MEVKKVGPKDYNSPALKKTDEKGYDEDGVLHEHCGTPDCCGECDTADSGVSNDNNGKKWFRSNLLGLV